jgi:hypothetical protein
LKKRQQWDRLYVTWATRSFGLSEANRARRTGVGSAGGSCPTGQQGFPATTYYFPCCCGNGPSEVAVAIYSTRRSQHTADSAREGSRNARSYVQFRTA